MWRLRVVHSTGYAYKSAVTASFNEARLTPRSDSRQNVILNRVETVPATRSYRYVDYWGTAVTAFDLHAPHTELEVTGSSVVETDVAEKPEELAGWDDLDTEAVIDRFDEVLSPTRFTPHSKRIARVGQRIVKDHDPFEAVGAVAQWVRSELDYVPGTTGVHSSGLDALREGKGVCQDFAHLSLIMLRSMGIPARYVSGYLHPSSEAEVGTPSTARVTPGSRRGPEAGGTTTRPTIPRSMNSTSASAWAGTTRMWPRSGNLFGRGFDRSRCGRGGHSAGLTGPVSRGPVQTPGEPVPGADRRRVRSGGRIQWPPMPATGPRFPERWPVRNG